MTTYFVPADKNLPANQFIRLMLAANGGNYPALVKTEQGDILKKRYDDIGTPEYIGVNHTGFWMTANRAAAQIADGKAQPVNAAPLEVNAQ